MSDNVYFIQFKERLLMMITNRLRTKFPEERVQEILNNDTDMSMLDEYIEEQEDFRNAGRYHGLVTVLDYNINVLEKEGMLFIEWVPEIVPRMISAKSLFPPPPALDELEVEFADRYHDLGSELMERDDMIVFTEDLNMPASTKEYIELLCAICGSIEEVCTDDHGDWMPDVYLADTEIGTVCPGCQAYCEQGAGGVAEVKLERVDWSNASKLQLLILDQFRQEVKDESDSDASE